MSRNDVKLNGQSPGRVITIRAIHFLLGLSSRCTLPATCKLNYFGFMSVRDIALFAEPLRQLVVVGDEKGWGEKVSVDERRNENAK